jgi:hypothetical protein
MISARPEEPEKPLGVIYPAMEFCDGILRWNSAMEFCEERDSPNKGGAA